MANATTLYDEVSGDRTQPALRWPGGVRSAWPADLRTANGDLPRAVHVTGAGNLVAEDYLGNSATFVLDGARELPIRPARILAGTTVAGVIALY